MSAISCSLGPPPSALYSPIVVFSRAKQQDETALLERLEEVPGSTDEKNEAATSNYRETVRSETRNQL